MSIKNIIKKENKFGKEYLATVIDNNDPLKRGRLLVKIDAILGDIPFWVNSTLVAGSTKLLLIPEANDTIKVKFKNNDIYSGEWSLEGNPNNKSNIDPNKYGLQDAHGNKIIIDKQLGQIDIVTAEGEKATSIIINKDGTITLSGTSVIINAAQTTINGALNVTGTCIFEGITWKTHVHSYTHGGTSVGTDDTGLPKN